MLRLVYIIISWGGNWLFVRNMVSPASELILVMFQVVIRCPCIITEVDVKDQVNAGGFIPEVA